MRVFWGLIAVLVLVAIGFPIVSGMSAREKAEPPPEQTYEIAEQEPSAVPERMDPEPPAAVKPVEPPPAAPTAPSAPAETGAAEPPAPETPNAGSEEGVGSSATPEPAPTASAPLKVEETGPPAPPPDVSSRPEAERPPAEAAPAPSATGAEADAAGATKAAEEAPPPKILTKDDGSMLVDDRFVVKGKGTSDAPYEVTWELLLSANETYDPRLGRKKLPGRVSMLDGKYVRLVGYVAYPMFVEEPRELLSMLNQWDGCCIGVPPTPYDAVEVQLKDVVTKEERLATYGSVEGKFAVKPYLAGDWLVGLYVMENAKLTVKEYGGFGS